jgi:hypothetical protein
MTTIGEQASVDRRPAGEVYAFLQDMTHFNQLLPQERISDWKADRNECSFKVQGAATIGLRLEGGTEPTHVKMVATVRSPFPFTLDVHLTAENGQTKAWQVFNADLNPIHQDDGGKTAEAPVRSHRRPDGGGPSLRSSPDNNGERPCRSAWPFTVDLLLRSSGFPLITGPLIIHHGGGLVR